MLKVIFTKQIIKNSKQIKNFHSIHRNLQFLVKRKFEVEQIDNNLYFTLKKTKKRNEEINKLVVKKAMKSMMSINRKSQLRGIGIAALNEDKEYSTCLLPFACSSYYSKYSKIILN